MLTNLSDAFSQGHQTWHHSIC